MQTPENTRAHPPETLEGWYAQHQIFTYDRSMRRTDATPRVGSTQQSASEGWTTVVELIGSTADLMIIRFAPTLDEIGIADREFRNSLDPSLRLDSSFLSITEAGLYHLTAELARETAARGGKVGDDLYAEEVARRVAKERENSHVRRRLYPPLPDSMPYVCFYPMSKRRAPGQNWYALSLDERSRLMQTHGKTGRRYAGRVLQIITGAIGFEQWEWGVTLFAADPLDFKKLVTDMRFDEVSAQYAEFGEFYVGKIAEQGRSAEPVETP
jgi:hydrogen peroxide-dependent heme synthase